MTTPTCAIVGSTARTDLLGAGRAGAVRAGPQVRDTPAGFEPTCCIGLPAIDGVDVVKLSAATGGQLNLPGAEAGQLIDDWQQTT